MTLKRSTDFDLVVLKKSEDSDKHGSEKNARFEVLKPEDPKSQYTSLLRKKQDTVSQYTDITIRSKGDSGIRSGVQKNGAASENHEKKSKAENRNQVYLNWNPPHKRANGTKADTLDLNWNPSQKPADNIEAETLDLNLNPPLKLTDSTEAETLDHNWNPPHKPLDSAREETLDRQYFTWNHPQKSTEAETLGLNWNPPTEAETLGLNWNPPHRPTDRTRAETLGHQYLTSNSPRKPADSTNGLKCMLHLAAFSGLVCVLLVLTGAVVLGGVNRSAQARYQEESLKEADTFSRMLDNLTTQMRSLEETLRQTQADLVDTAALLEARLNRTEADIEFLAANTSQLSSHVESLTVNTSELRSHVRSLTANTSELSSHVGSLAANTSELSSQISNLNTTTMMNIRTAGMNYTRLNSNLSSVRRSLQMVDAFSGCTEVNMSCSPAEHNSNEFLYTCSTNSTEIRTQVSGGK